ncbi:hypothetical protein TNCV_3309211 [Trichonephila clavipes]|nr:hypothetical protein TNCV_3309211 [Trichonephila clavipes]
MPTTSFYGVVPRSNCVGSRLVKRLTTGRLPKHSVHSTYFIYLSNALAWLLDHLTPSLPVPTDDFVSSLFIESSALEQVVTISSGIAAEYADLVSSQATNEY